MYDYFEHIAYPLESLSSLNSIQQQALKSAFVDFRMNVYSAEVDQLVQLTVKTLDCSSNSLKLDVDVRLLGRAEPVLARATLEFPNDSYASQQFVRYHFDSSDFTNLDPAYTLEGFFCFSNLDVLIATLAPFGPIGISSRMELSTISIFSHHRVEQISCRNALPLLNQSSTTRYGPTSAAVLGDVRFVPGNNCTISVQPATRTILIGAQQNANDSSEEQCGIWSEKVGDKDILCNEAIYSISGVEPDSSGNVQIQASNPLTVSSFTIDEMRTNYPAFSAVLSPFSHIIRFIYIGLPQSAGNPSVFDCIR